VKKIAEDIVIEGKKKKSFIDFFIRKLEKILSEHLIFAKLYTAFFYKMTIDEFKMIDLPENSKVVNIGCGSLPHTLIILAKQRKWNMVGIDHDKVAIKKAVEMIKHYDLSDKIKIMYGEGISVDYSQFNLIIISHGVEPKKQVLEKLGKEIDKKSMILYRTIWDGLNRVYGKEPVPSNLKIINTYDRIDGIKAFLLMKNIHQGKTINKH